MSQSDLVYAYETNFIAALETILDVALTQTVAFGDTTVHTTPRIEVGFTYGGADQIDRGLTSDGKQYLRKHNGTINLTVSGIEKAAHLALVGEVRNFMAWNVPTLINPVLAFYQVQSVFEQGGSNDAGDEEGDFEISTELNFDVVFQIPPAAFDLITNIAITDGADDKAINADCSTAGSDTYYIKYSVKPAGAGSVTVRTTLDGTTPSNLNATAGVWTTQSKSFTGTPSHVAVGWDGSAFSEADWSNVALWRLVGPSPNPNVDELIENWLCAEQSSGSLNGVTAIGELGNFDGIYDGCTGGTTSDL